LADRDFPDIYADGVSVAAGAYGVTLSFLLSDPFELDPGPGVVPGRIIGRVRISPELAKALVQSIESSLARAPQPEVVEATALVVKAEAGE
jgi:hypothetical protein